MEASPKRLHLRNFISASTCQELEFIHKSCGVVGYRPFVLSTTLLHLVATNFSCLIMPFVSIREKVKEMVEECYGCEYELFVEFTGLISWTKGAKIGWHCDNGRTYLKQRHFTAVCYLNSHALDFHGGLFHFQDGNAQTTIIPQMGDVLIYRAEDMHCVDEVTQGERCTLALWFTLDSSCDEDAKILNSIRLSLTNSPLPGVHVPSTDNDIYEKFMWKPIPASSSMYLMEFADESKKHKRKRAESFRHQCDIRVTRSRELGFEFCVVVHKLFVPMDEIEGQPNAESEVLQDALEGPLKVKADGHIVPYIFANSIHALQVLYFSRWKSLEGRQEGADMESRLVDACSNVPVDMRARLLCGKVSAADDDDTRRTAGRAAKAIITTTDSLERILESKGWEEYLFSYRTELQRCFPVWDHFKCISAHVSE